MAEKQLAKAIALVKQGNKADAVQIVKSVLQQESKNVKAWWMMANLLEKPEQKEKAAQKILELQPEHSGAKKLLASLKGTQPQKPEPRPGRVRGGRVLLEGCGRRRGRAAVP